MTRRRPSTTAVLTCLVLLVLGAVMASDWIAGRTGATLPWTPADLVPASARDHPQRGYEEAGERLAPPVSVAEEDASYAFQHTVVEDGREAPVAWSPCRPVHVVVDPTGAPADFPAQVWAALDEVAAATGLVFADDGLADEPTSLDRAAFQPDRYGDRWAPVLVGFADASGVPDLSGDVSGIAGVQMVEAAMSRSAHLVTGTVYLDTELLTPAPGRTGLEYLAVLRHELGHLVGLDHVDDPTQIMYPSTGVPTFQPGDLAGLAALGRGDCAPGV
ncbi:matrixin family metalloprotease [Cellulomonas sp. Marseille-Q8402]